MIRINIIICATRPQLLAAEPDIFVADSVALKRSNLIQYSRAGEKNSVDTTYRYMRGKTAVVAHKMLHEMAKLIGFKQTTLLVDSCVLDIFESMSERIGEHRSMCDADHSRWLDKHFGLVVIATEVSIMNVVALYCSVGAHMNVSPYLYRCSSHFVHREARSG